MQKPGTESAAADAQAGWPAESRGTHCPYCALQCAIEVRVASPRVLVRARPFPTNRGILCPKGWAAAEPLHHPDRLLTPLLRDGKGARLRPAPWDEALDRIASAIRRIQSDCGRDAFGLFGGGSLTNEKAYLLGKFARVALKTRSIDYNGRFCMASAAVALKKAFGLDRGLPFPIADIAQAQVLVLVGANIAETMPPLQQYFEEQRRRGGRLVVIDPRATPTARRADLHLALRPGSDAALALGLLHLIIAQGRVDTEFVERRTTGFEEVRRQAVAFWPERAARLTGLSSWQLRETAALLGNAETLIVLSGRGQEQQSRSVGNLLAWINLCLALGKVGKPFCGFGSLTGQGNGQGGREHGQKADQLPGYRSIEAAADRARLCRFWKVADADLPGSGPTADPLLRSCGEAGGLRGLFVMGANPAVSAPKSLEVIERLERLDFLVVSDFFLSETAALADVVLPAAQWAEEEGTVTNLEGRVLLRERALPPPPGVRTDLQILHGLACRLGCGQAFPAESPRVFDELRRASAGGAADYSGISYARLREGEGIFWPCPGADHPGTPRLFLDRFATGNGKARFHPIEESFPAELPDSDFPLWLITGRLLVHYQSGTQTRRSPTLLAMEPEPTVAIHPETAKGLRIKAGDGVRVTTRRGSLRAIARISEELRIDCLFAPFHWGGEGSVNRVTNPALDPESGMPEFKLCSARLERETEGLSETKASLSEATPGSKGKAHDEQQDP
ncbi:molybdopterin oxidoreductase family protein [Methylacidimicrobium sp. AP8]|uniref:molybdopterin oxidoreductase family protein n=1 Tax=Methylacidimicrobium sp. AP8 TaxID=2730359 RepID=UPI001922C3D7